MRLHGLIEVLSLACHKSEFNKKASPTPWAYRRVELYKEPATVLIGFRTDVVVDSLLRRALHVGHGRRSIR